MTVRNIVRRAAVPLALMAVMLAVMAGCAKIRPLSPAVAQRGDADYGIYVAMGTNFTAGFQSGGLAQRHQRLSYAALFAAQAGTPAFTFPAVNLGGWPPLLRVRTFEPLTFDSAGIRGAFINPLTNPVALLDSAYHNMSIPGALLADVMNPTLNYTLGIGRDVSFFYNIARQQGRPIPLSILQLVRNKRPTFVSFEYGLNELLGPAINGSGTPAVPSAAWAGLLHLTLDSLEINCPQAKKLLVNVYDVTKTPFFHTIPRYAIDENGQIQIGPGGPSALLGPDGPLQPGDLVTLRAADSLALGVGFEVGTTSYYSGAPVPGTGRPLPGSMVLTSQEAHAISVATFEYNTAIAAEAAARGYALLDVWSLLEQYSRTGVKFAGATYTTKYLTGGLFSVDGLHPTDLFHGLVANAMIDVVNRRFGSSIPPLDLSKVMTPTSSAIARARD